MGEQERGAQQQQRRRRRLLLVLDLNGLLLDSFGRGDDRPPALLGPVVKAGGKWIYERPGAQEFLRFCFSRFEVGVWSCAREENVHNYVAAVLPEDLQHRLLFVWGQSRCTDTGRRVPRREGEGGAFKPLFLKELAVLWAAFPQYGMTNTIMLDDTPYKSLRNPTFTAVFPKPYSARAARDDGWLLREAVPWLRALSVSSDTVQSFVIRNPLGEPAIAPGHRDWDLFSDVVYAKSFQRGAGRRGAGRRPDQVEEPPLVEQQQMVVEQQAAGLLLPRAAAAAAAHCSSRTYSPPFPLPIGFPELLLPSEVVPPPPLLGPPGFQHQRAAALLEPPPPPWMMLEPRHQHHHHHPSSSWPVLPAAAGGPWTVRHQQQPQQQHPAPPPPPLLSREEERSRMWVAGMFEIAQQCAQPQQQGGFLMQGRYGGPQQGRHHNGLMGGPVALVPPYLPPGFVPELEAVSGSRDRRSRRERRNRSHPY